MSSGAIFSLNGREVTYTSETLRNIANTEDLTRSNIKDYYKDLTQALQTTYS